MLMLGMRRDEDFAAVDPPEPLDHEVDPLLQGQPEPSHPVVGQGDLAEPALLEEERDHTAPAADDVPVPDARKAGVLGAGVGVALDEELLGAGFLPHVEVDRVDRLVLSSAGTRGTPTSIAASITFCAPRTLVLIASNGLYIRCGDLFHLCTLRGGVDDDVDVRLEWPARAVRGRGRRR